MDTAIRAILATNIRKMIAADSPQDERPSVRAWALSKGLDARLVDRVVKGEHAITLDTLEAIANACNVPVWKLLHTEFSPSASPQMQLTLEDIAFLKKLRRFVESS